MVETESTSLEEMKRFLFHEMSHVEREAIEERFFSDQDFFYELMELENSLVDRYVRKELTGDDLIRFETSLGKSPERLEKIRDAIALQSLIEKEDRMVRPVINETPTGILDKIAAFFAFQLPVSGYVAAATLIVMFGAFAYLVYERTRLNRELAGFREKQDNSEELRRQEQELQTQLNDAKERESSLKNQLDETEGAKDRLEADLRREETERKRIESELDRLKTRQKELQAPLPQRPRQISPPKPTIATIVLTPFLGSRDGTGNDVGVVRLGANVKSVNLNLQIPKESTADMYNVRFKEQTIAAKQRPQTAKSGVKSVSVTISADRFSTGAENTVTLVGNDGRRYDYLLKVE